MTNTATPNTIDAIHPKDLDGIVSDVAATMAVGFGSVVAMAAEAAADYGYEISEDTAWEIARKADAIFKGRGR